MVCVTGTRAACCESSSGRILLFFLVAFLWHHVQRAVGPGNLPPYLVNQRQGPSSEQGAGRPGSASPHVCPGTRRAASRAAVQRGSPHFPPWRVTPLHAFPSRLPGLFKSSTKLLISQREHPVDAVCFLHHRVPCLKSSVGRSVSGGGRQDGACPCSTREPPPHPCEDTLGVSGCGPRDQKSLCLGALWGPPCVSVS